MSGSISSSLSKSKYSHQFDACFVSSRYAQIVKEPWFADLFSDQLAKPLIVVESAKFLVGLNKDTQQEFNKQVHQLIDKERFVSIQEKTPISLRYRDERDKDDQLLFYTRK